MLLGEPVIVRRGARAHRYGHEALPVEASLTVGADGVRARIDAKLDTVLVPRQPILFGLHVVVAHPDSDAEHRLRMREQHLEASVAGSVMTAGVPQDLGGRSDAQRQAAPFPEGSVDDDLPS